MMTIQEHLDSTVSHAIERGTLAYIAKRAREQGGVRLRNPHGWHLTSAYPMSLIGAQQLQNAFAEISAALDASGAPPEHRYAFVSPYTKEVALCDRYQEGRMAFVTMERPFLLSGIRVCVSNNMPMGVGTAEVVAVGCCSCGPMFPWKLASDRLPASYCFEIATAGNKEAT